MWQRALALDVTLARKAWPACQRSLTLRSLRVSFLTLYGWRRLARAQGRDGAGCVCTTSCINFWGTPIRRIY